MNLVPPFMISGEAGKALGPYWVVMGSLGVHDAFLTLRSIAADELTFALRPKAGSIIPDDQQWVTVADAVGLVLFRGILKRSYKYPQGIYSYSAASVYAGLLETPLADVGRPYVTYPLGDLWDTIHDIIRRANADGLSIQAPDPTDMPSSYLVPKMAFRSSSNGSAVEDCLKWAPDTVTRLDQTSTPPTLRFACRSTATPLKLELDAEGHGVLSVELTPYPEARALSVAFAYARRDGSNIVNYFVQQAGDDNAEAHRKVSIYLSGAERSDMMVSEALTTAQKAVATAEAAVTAVGGNVDTAAASAGIALTWSNLITLDSALQAAVTAEPGFVMSVGGMTYALYSACVWSGTSYASLYSGSIGGLYLSESNGAYAAGWYAVRSGSFTDTQLTTAGATKVTKYIRGNLIYTRYWGTGYSAGLNAITGSCSQISGWLSDHAANQNAANDLYRDYRIYPVNIAVDAINMAPSAVAAAVKAAAASGSSSLIERAEFVEAPPDLAASYFARQDWTPYKGTLEFAPGAPVIPYPGNFINVTGTGTPEEWSTMRAPVYETQIDLRTGRHVVTVGPSPRMDFSSLVDRLRIPVEDNYQAG